MAEQPGNAAAQFCLAYCRQQQGQYTRAVERYDVAQVLMPSDPLPAYQRGVCFATVRRSKDAEAEFTRALEKGRMATIEATSRRGNKTIYSFPLKGFTAVMKKARQGCR